VAQKLYRRTDPQRNEARKRKAMKIYFLILLVGSIAVFAHMPMSLKRPGAPKAS